MFRFYQPAPLPSISPPSAFDYRLHFFNPALNKYLTGRPLQGAAAEKVVMQVENQLPGIFQAIADQPETFPVEAGFSGNNTGNALQMTDNPFLLFC